ncbi:hypothetical protein B0H21DRAFT_834360 [Amylocystis lapponica]|nr:hypothetical protein B0H21DRAFT_834360 [Amylocystis lapponica]
MSYRNNDQYNQDPNNYGSAGEYTPNAFNYVTTEHRFKQAVSRTQPPKAQTGKVNSSRGQQGYQDPDAQVPGTKYNAGTANDLSGSAYAGNTDGNSQGNSSSIDTPGAGGDVYGSGRNQNNFQSTGQSEWQSSAGGGAGGYDQGDYDDQVGNRPAGHASVGDRLKGNAEKMAGRVTGNTGMKERGEERKLGEL